MKIIFSNSLDRMPALGTAFVVSVHGDRGFRRRLMELGLVPGTPIQRLDHTWFGDPIRVRVRDGVVALRRRDAAMVEVSE